MASTLDELSLRRVCGLVLQAAGAAAVVFVSGEARGGWLGWLWGAAQPHSAARVGVIMTPPHTRISITLDSWYWAVFRVRVSRFKDVICKTYSLL